MFVGCVVRPATNPVWFFISARHRGARFIIMQIACNLSVEQAGYVIRFQPEVVNGHRSSDND